MITVLKYIDICVAMSLYNILLPRDILFNRVSSDITVFLSYVDPMIYHAHCPWTVLNICVIFVSTPFYLFKKKNLLYTFVCIILCNSVFGPKYYV